jgi:hypothetical protein
MRNTYKACSILGLILTGGLTKVCQGATTDPLKTQLTITIHVYNYAEVPAKTLMRAERVAAGVFRTTGVEIRWRNIDVNLENKQANLIDEEFHPLDILLNILSRPMTETFGLPPEIMGFVPGVGHDPTIYTSSTTV